MTVKQNTFWQGLFTLLSLVSILSGVYGLDPPPVTTPTSPSTPSTPKTAEPSQTLPRLAGINLAGFDFGAQTNGQYTRGTNPPAVPPETQIPHFLSQKVNLFRAPVAWEFLQPEMSAELDVNNLKTYKELVEKITTKQAYVAIDLHSYARYKGQIVGESSNTPADALVDFWLRIGKVFKDNPFVIFGISNEPHDLDIAKWATTVQAVVTALRTHDIHNVLTIPGTDYTSLKAFPEWYKAMKVVKNPDGSFDGLVFEVHLYLDSDNSGTHPECVASHADAVATAVALLKADGRQAILAEIGGGNTASCEKFLPELIKAVTEAYPVFTGFAMWAAGAFDEKYELVTTVKDATSPTGWKDMPNWLSIVQFLPKGSNDSSKSITPNPAKAKNNKKNSACKRQRMV